MGKSHYIKGLEKKLRKKKNYPQESVCVTIPIHGSGVNYDVLMRFFKDFMQHPPCTIYHIDLASSVCTNDFKNIDVLSLNNCDTGV